jgi:hypothetical protein
MPGARVRSGLLYFDSKRNRLAELSRIVDRLSTVKEGKVFTWLLRCGRFNLDHVDDFLNVESSKLSRDHSRLGGVQQAKSRLAGKRKNVNKTYN